MVTSRPNLSKQHSLQSRSDLLRFCCAICAADADAARQLVAECNDRIDWMALVELAKDFRLEMLLYRAVESRFAEFVSPPALDTLRRLHANHQAQCQDKTAGLLHLLSRLASEQIPAIPFKGPALAAQFYGDVALRIYGDLDLLVHERDLAKATAIMRDLGYRATEMSLSWECSFAHDNGTSVDVHWAIMEKSHQFPLTPDELWSRRTTISMAGTPAPTLCAEDALLAICFNGLTEDWQRADRIADVAELMRVSGATIDWSQLLDMCRQRGCERLVLVGLHLAKELFLVKLPEAVELRLRSHRKAMDRAGYAIEAFVDFMVTSTDRRAGVDDWRHMTRMRERHWERVPYHQAFAYSLLKPQVNDARWQRTSRQVVYSVLRLPLLGLKHGLRVLGHTTLKRTDNRP